MVVQTSCLCSFLCVKWQRFKAFVSTGVHCLRHELGPFAHILTRSHSLTFLGARSPTLPYHTSTSLGNSLASRRCRHLKCSLQRAWENPAPGAHLSEAGDRRGRVRRQEKLFRDTSTPCLFRVVDLFNLLLVSHGGNNIVAFGHCHTLFQIITQWES